MEGKSAGIRDGDPHTGTGTPLKGWRVLHQGRGAVRAKEQWKKNSKKQKAEEIGTDLELLCQPTPH